jgi:hypothetical protein
MIIYIEIFLIINIMISIITLIIIHEVTYIKYSKLIIIGQVVNIIYLLFYKTEEHDNTDTEEHPSRS